MKYLKLFEDKIVPDEFLIDITDFGLHANIYPAPGSPSGSEIDPMKFAFDINGFVSVDGMENLDFLTSIQELISRICNMGYKITSQRFELLGEAYFSGRFVFSKTQIVKPL